MACSAETGRKASRRHVRAQRYSEERKRSGKRQREKVGDGCWYLLHSWQQRQRRGRDDPELRVQTEFGK